MTNTELTKAKDRVSAAARHLREVVDPNGPTPLRWSEIARVASTTLAKVRCFVCQRCLTTVPLRGRSKNSAAVCTSELTEL